MKKLIFPALLFWACSYEPDDCGNLYYRINAEYDIRIERVKDLPDASEQIEKLNYERQRRLRRVLASCRDFPGVLM